MFFCLLQNNVFYCMLELWKIPQSYTGKKGKKHEKKTCKHFSAMLDPFIHHSVCFLLAIEPRKGRRNENDRGHQSQR